MKTEIYQMKKKFSETRLNNHAANATKLKREISKLEKQLSKARFALNKEESNYLKEVEACCEELVDEGAIVKLKDGNYASKEYAESNEDETLPACLAKLNCRKPKAVVPPTIEELKTFAQRFSTSEWGWLSADTRFTNTLHLDLKKATEIASKILRKELK